MKNQMKISKRSANNSKFPAVPLIVMLLSFFILVYSIVGVVVFVHSLRTSAEPESAAVEIESSDETAPAEIGEQALNEQDDVSDDENAAPIERGNLKFTTEELFNIKDASSTGGMILLFVFCTLSIGSIVALVFCYRAIVKSGLRRSVKTLVIIVGTILSLLIAIFVTYQLVQLQLDLFKDKKDTSPINRNETNVDEDGYIYFVDGNGTPYLSLEIDDDEVSNDDYIAATKSLNIESLDYLYVTCDFTKDESGKIKINGFFIDDDDGNSKKVELECLSTSLDSVIYYRLTAGSFSARYKLLTAANTDVRSDPDAKTTFLIVGKDRVGSNTDVMILISLHEEEDGYKADILQIPRDTFCRDNSSNNKINAIYGTYRRASTGATETDKITDGMEGLKSVLERNWLIKIDYWAIMNLDGFGQIVDGIGGVDMYVPFDMDYDDPTAVPELHIHLKEGQQTLYSSQAEQFIRYRKGYVTGDLGRVDATKLFLTAFFINLREEISITNPSALTSTISTLMDYVTTNMDTGNAISFVKMVLTLTLEDITFINLPGSDYAKAPGSSLSYYTSNRRGMYYVINKYFNVYDTDINENEFDASRMFTTQNRYTELDNAHNAGFDVEAYESTLRGADEIQQSQDNQENNLPVVGRLRN